jgi:hypothetical protein
MGSPRSALVALVALLAACEEGVELGTQCRSGVGCTEGTTRPLPAADATAGALDGGANVSPEAQPGPDGGGSPFDPDAGSIDAAGLDESNDFFRNGSLEVSTDGGFGDFAVLDISFQENRGVIAPWTPCQVVNFNSNTDAGLLQVDTAAHTLQSSMVVDGKTVVPAEGSTFMAMSFPPLIPPAVVVIPISQVLPSPLREGQTYAFSARVLRVDHRHDYTLRIFLSDGVPTCAPGGPAVADVAVPDVSEWREVCLSFTPDADYAEFMLAAGTNSVAISPDKTVGYLLDSLHQVPTCPP